MKNLFKLSFLGLLLFSFSTASFAQKKAKKTRTFTIKKVLPFSADKVWNILEDYGGIAYSHPKIVKSNYINGSLKAEKGAERVCYFNEKESRWVHERITHFDDQNLTFTNIIYHADNFPLDTDNSKGIYKVTPIDENSSEISFQMIYRTKPAFMGGMMKGSFKKLIKDYFIAIEHKIGTGEDVTKENFKQIKKLYAAK